MAVFPDLRAAVPAPFFMGCISLTTGSGQLAAADAAVELGRLRGDEGRKLASRKPRPTTTSPPRISSAWMPHSKDSGYVPLPKLYGTEKDWQTVADRSPAAWKGAQDSLFQTADGLSQAIKGFQDKRLHDIVHGRQYDF